MWTCHLLRLFEGSTGIHSMYPSMLVGLSRQYFT